jgi:hypothetical protein
MAMPVMACQPNSNTIKPLSPTWRPRAQSEVGAFYWTAPAPDIVNSGREEQGLVSV